LREALSLLGVAGKLAEVTGDKRFADFNTARLKYNSDEIVPMWTIIGAIDPKRIAEHSGDVFAIAKDSQERMWRVEAILQLGRLRYNAASGADQRAANRMLKKMAENETDPIIRAAAKAAAELTIEKYRMQ
jgi:hypothetical protein